MDGNNRVLIIPETINLSDIMPNATPRERYEAYMAYTDASAGVLQRFAAQVNQAARLIAQTFYGEAYMGDLWAALAAIDRHLERRDRVKRLVGDDDDAPTWVKRVRGRQINAFGSGNGLGPGYIDG